MLGFVGLLLEINCIAYEALAKRSSQLKPTRAKFTTSMDLGIVWPPTWLELARGGSSWLEFDQTRIFAQPEPSFPPFGHDSQLEPSCFVFVMGLRGRIHTIEWFLDSWLDCWFCNLAWVGSTVCPGLENARARACLFFVGNSVSLVPRRHRRIIVAFDLYRSQCISAIKAS